MKRRNPQAPHRHKSWTDTQKRLEQYRGIEALLITWEQQPEAVQIANHDYIIALRGRLRQVRVYITHRADPEANI